MDINSMLAAGVSDAMYTRPPNVEGRVLHVDGDYLAYWTGIIESPQVARKTARDKIEEFASAAQCATALVHLTDPGSTKGDRGIISTVRPYQEKRSGNGKPVNWAYVRDYLSAMSGDITCKTWSRREADDGIAYCAHIADPIAIAAKDKDMRMIPGYHVVWDTCEVVEVPRGAYCVEHGGKVYGMKWFWLQCLMGDTVDNIPGLEKYVKPNGKTAACGEKTALAMLDGIDNTLDAGRAVAEQYELYYADEWRERLVEQMLLLWLRTDRDGSIFDLRKVLPFEGDDELWAIDARIKETYAEIEAIRAGRVPK